MCSWILLYDHTVAAYWLRHYATIRKVAGSRPHKVNGVLIYLILPAALGPGVYSASNRNEYRSRKTMFVESRE
jgi:hypothetical protein